MSVTDSSGNPVTGNIDTDKTFINDFRICKILDIQSFKNLHISI